MAISSGVIDTRIQQQFSGLESNELKETHAIFTQIRMAIKEKSYTSACLHAKELHSFALSMITKALKTKRNFFLGDCRLSG